MNSIRIGNADRRLDEVEESWIAQQSSRRRRDGESVCVKVVLEEAHLCDRR